MAQTSQSLLNQFKGSSAHRQISNEVIPAPVGRILSTNLAEERFWAQPLRWKEWAILSSLSGNVICARLPKNPSDSIQASPLFRMSGPAYSSGVFVDENTLLIGSDGGDLLLCRLFERGSNLFSSTVGEWKLKGAIHGNPLLDAENDLVLVPCYDGSVHFFSYQDGLKWLRSVQLSTDIEDDVYSTPVKVGEDQYIVGSGRDIVLFSSNGVLKRHVTSGFVDSSPAFSDAIERIAVGSDDGIFRILHSDSLEIDFEIRTGSRIQTSPAIIGNNFSFGTKDGTVYLIDPISRSIRKVPLDTSVEGADYTKGRPNSFFFQSFTSSKDNFFVLDGLGRINKINPITGQTTALLAASGLHATPLWSEDYIISGSHFGDIVFINSRYL